MKANEAPEKIYLQPSAIEQLPYQNIVYKKPLADNSIEYIRKDAFIEKACDWLEAHSPFVNDDILDVWLDNFKEAMKL